MSKPRIKKIKPTIENVNSAALQALAYAGALDRRIRELESTVTVLGVGLALCCAAIFLLTREPRGMNL